MKDHILEDVWKAKEAVSLKEKGDFHQLARFIKDEAKKITGGENLRQPIKKEQVSK